MPKFGYARVSTNDQDCGIQVAALNAAGCDRVWSEKVSASSLRDRVELAAMMAHVRKGDTVLVTRIDRLARSIGDLQDIVRDLKARDIELQATEQPIDTKSAAGKAFLDMLGVFAEFETNLRRERQAEGIAKAKAEGAYRGRPAKFDADEVRRLRSEGLGGTAIAQRLGMGRASVYRLLGAAACIGRWTSEAPSGPVGRGRAAGADDLNDAR